MLLVIFVGRVCSQPGVYAVPSQLVRNGPPAYYAVSHQPAAKVQRRHHRLNNTLAWSMAFGYSRTPQSTVANSSDAALVLICPYKLGISLLSEGLSFFLSSQNSSRTTSISASSQITPSYHHAFQRASVPLQGQPPKWCW